MKAWQSETRGNRSPKSVSPSSNHVSCSARRQVDPNGTLSVERKDKGANLGAKDVRMMRPCVENARGNCVPDVWKHNVREVSLHICQFENCQPSVNDLETDGPRCEDSNLDLDKSGFARAFGFGLRGEDRGRSLEPNTLPSRAAFGFDKRPMSFRTNFDQEVQFEDDLVKKSRVSYSVESTA